MTKGQSLLNFVRELPAPLSPEILTEPILAALPFAVVRIDRDDIASYVNPAAEELLGAGAAYLTQGLKRVLLPDSPVFALIERTRKLRQPVREHAVRLVLPRRGLSFEVDLDVTPLGPDGGGEGSVLLCLRERAILLRLDRQHQQRESARIGAGGRGARGHAGPRSEESAFRNTRRGAIA